MINYTPIAFQSPLYVQPVNDAFAALQKYFTEGGGGFGGAGLSVADFTTMSGPLIWALQSSNAQALYMQASGTASHMFSINATGVTSSVINLQAGGTSLTSLLRVVQTSASATFPSVLLNNTNSSALVRGILLSGSGITAESTGNTPLTVPIVDTEGYIRLALSTSPGPIPTNGAAYVDTTGLRLRAGGSWCPGNIDNTSLTKNNGITLKVNGITPRKQSGTAFFATVNNGPKNAFITVATITFTGTSGRYAMVGFCSTNGGAGRLERSGVNADTTVTVTGRFLVNGNLWTTRAPASLAAAGTADFAASSLMAIVPIVAGLNTANFSVDLAVTYAGVQAYVILL